MENYGEKNKPKEYPLRYSENLIEEDYYIFRKFFNVEFILSHLKLLSHSIYLMTKSNILRASFRRFEHVTNFENFEYKGDKRINFSISEKLDKLISLSGSHSAVMNQIQSNLNMALVFDYLGLDYYFEYHDSKQGIKNRSLGMKQKADILESIVGELDEYLVDELNESKKGLVSSSGENAKTLSEYFDPNPTTRKGFEVRRVDKTESRKKRMEMEGFIRAVYGCLVEVLVLVGLGLYNANSEKYGPAYLYRRSGYTNDVKDGINQEVDRFVYKIVKKSKNQRLHVTDVHVELRKNGFWEDNRSISLIALGNKKLKLISDNYKIRTFLCYFEKNRDLKKHQSEIESMYREGIGFGQDIHGMIHHHDERRPNRENWKNYIWYKQEGYRNQNWEKGRNEHGRSKNHNQQNEQKRKNSSKRTSNFRSRSRNRSETRNSGRKREGNFKNFYNYNTDEVKQKKGKNFEDSGIEADIDEDSRYNKEAKKYEELFGSESGTDFEEISDQGYAKREGVSTIPKREENFNKKEVNTTEIKRKDDVKRNKRRQNEEYKSYNKIFKKENTIHPPTPYPSGNKKFEMTENRKKNLHKNSKKGKRNRNKEKPIRGKMTNQMTGNQNFNINEIEKNLKFFDSSSDSEDEKDGFSTEVSNMTETESDVETRNINYEKENVSDYDKIEKMDTTHLVFGSFPQTNDKKNLRERRDKRNIRK